MIERLARYETPARYDCVFAGRDLLGDYTLIRAWGGKRSRRGGCCIEILPDRGAVGTRVAAIGRRRVSRGYRASRGESLRFREAVIESPEANLLCPDFADVFVQRVD